MAASSRDFFRNQLGLCDQTRPAVRKASAHLSKVIGIWEGAADTAATPSRKPNWDHLNDTGKKAARQDALADSFRDIARVKFDLARMRKHVEASQPTLPPIDRKDVVGAMLDAEYRALVRAMPADKRAAISRGDVSPEVLAAVARGAPELSGIPPSVHESLRNSLVEAAYPQEIRKLQQDAQAIQWAEQATRDAERHLQEVGGFAHRTERDAYTKRVLEPIVVEEKAIAEAEQKDDEDLTLETLFARVRNVDVSKRIKFYDRLLQMNTEDIFSKDAA